MLVFAQVAIKGAIVVIYVVVLKGRHRIVLKYVRAARLFVITGPIKFLICVDLVAFAVDRC